MRMFIRENIFTKFGVKQVTERCPFSAREKTIIRLDSEQIESLKKEELYYYS